MLLHLTLPVAATQSGIQMSGSVSEMCETLQGLAHVLFWHKNWGSPNNPNNPNTHFREKKQIMIQLFLLGTFPFSLSQTQRPQTWKATYPELGIISHRTVLFKRNCLHYAAKSLLPTPPWTSNTLHDSLSAGIVVLIKMTHIDLSPREECIGCCEAFGNLQSDQLRIRNIPKLSIGYHRY